MFTGIIEATGKVDGFSSRGGDWHLKVSSGTLSFDDVRLGDSIAVSGVCLTVMEMGADWFAADVSNETVKCTAMCDLSPGDEVNLEKAMTPSSRLGGHIVSGHVDGLAELLERKADARSERLRFRVPGQLARYIAAKGSVCLDGVSLTVNEVDGLEFGINIIPHTASVTTMRFYRPGRRVNLEVDLLSRYLERLLEAREARREHEGLLDHLVRNGFTGRDGE